MQHKLDYPQKQFEHAIVAVDVVIFTILDSQLSVLLLELKEAPLTGKWALPGGLVRVDEDCDQAVARHLQEKANVSDIYTEQLFTFSAIDRDPHGRVISVSYFTLAPQDKLHPQTTPRYQGIALHPLSRLPDLAYDHRQIIDTALSRLRSKIEYTNVVYSLLPKEFTLTQLQSTYEVILGRPLDKRNFRKKILSLGLVKSLDRTTAGLAHRPAQLYAFINRKPTFANIL
ncbi:hypothetical protein A2368_00910 [Candidatus Collierbacteria bacterium RIFOXYB1_FULL_49_13]|uniref:Nudix hydrolase domain-containing protein n=1 Tax=Candidatus Collierbacteria bacterium RIFOXYB1_FULL_49_13 TaxID=1817728 RepID=A0A1F5FHP8_9BACT|nr:MAG: hypothetical protein A2368_00910 [Candidatus Collierbacteria bacterium RIFOXYB1_FULL_49_13]